MFQVQIPGVEGVTQLLITGFVILVGIVILIAIVKVVLHFFLAIVAGVIVWVITLNVLLAALGFLAVAILTTGRRKQTIVYAQPSGRVCPKCGFSLAQNARFCPNCGQNI